MRSLKFPTADDEQYYKDITSSKQEPNRTYLLGAQSTVFASYVDYINKAPAVDAVSSVSLSADECKALLHAYNVETSAMGRLRELLLSAPGAQRCPFCDVGESSTLDHYLPKKRYPQYAIFSKNLVPCCGRCNQKKLEQLLEPKSKARLFLHPYFDSVPGVRFLSISMTLRQDAIVLRYYLTPPTGMAQSVFSQISTHFDRLGLADRYRLMSLDELRGQYRVIAKRYGAQRNARGVQELLADQATSLAAEFGQNHWRAALYDALASHTPFCEGGFHAILKS